MDMKKGVLISMLVVMFVLATALSSEATYEYNVFGRPLTFSGYISETAQFGLNGSKHITSMSGLNSLMNQSLLEMEYKVDPYLIFFASGSFNEDSAYDINTDNEWENKGFPGSRDRLYIFDNWQDALKECDLTYARHGFFLRVGKQIVQWGQTDAFLLTNLINPIDQRRGLGDVTFVDTLLPIWLIRAEYNVIPDSTWLQMFGIQFVLDPDVSFRGNQVIEPGTNYMGIWSPYVQVPFPAFLSPGGVAYVGSFNQDTQGVDSFDPDFFTYGVKVSAEIHGALISLLGYYGIDRDFAYTNDPAATTVSFNNPFDGRAIIHPGIEAYYPRLKFIGGTFTKDLSGIVKVPDWLGGASPVLRFETLYAFGCTYGKNDIPGTQTQTSGFAKTDEYRMMIGFDQKLKINWLNPTTYFLIMPQFFYFREMDFSDQQALAMNNRLSLGGLMHKNNFRSSFVVTTSYFHNKLVPTLAWVRDWSNQAQMLLPSIEWIQSDHWSYKLGGSYFSGSKNAVSTSNGFAAFAYSDQVYFTATYTF